VLVVLVLVAFVVVVGFRQEFFRRKSSADLIGMAGKPGGAQKVGLGLGFVVAVLMPTLLPLGEEEVLVVLVLVVYVVMLLVGLGPSAQMIGMTG